MQLRSTLTLAGILCALASPASAQEIVTTILGLGDRTSGQFDLVDLATTTAFPISAAECENDSIDFRFTMVDVNRATLHFYQGDGCNDPNVRTDMTSSACVDLGVQRTIDSTSQVDWSVPIRDLIDCSSTSGTPTMWVLALDQPTSEVTGTGQSDTFPLAFDFEGPSAPGGFTVRNSEPAIELSWENGTAQINGYEVFLSVGGCEGGRPTVTFDPDVDLPVAMLDGSDTSATINYDSDVAFGTESAVAIRSIDQAGNASDLSTVRCATRIEVTSWWDTHCAGGGSTDACAGGECSIQPGRSGAPFGWLAVLGVAGLALSRRRR